MLENRFVLAGSHVLSAGAPATCVCPSLCVYVCVCAVVGDMTLSAGLY